MSKMENVLTASRWYKNGSFVPDDVIFTADEYNRFIDSIRDYICEYSYISVGDLIDLAASRMASDPSILKPANISYNYIWTNISEFGYERVEKGDPKPTDTWRLLAEDPIYERII